MIYIWEELKSIKLLLHGVYWLNGAVRILAEWFDTPFGHTGIVLLVYVSEDKKYENDEFEFVEFDCINAIKWEF